MLEINLQQKTQNLLGLPRTKIMAILNVTPDSFSGDGIVQDQESIHQVALARVHKFVASHADILDIGGESTRPGADEVTEEEEIERVIPVIQAIRQHYDIPISIDTTKSMVARKALAAGANIINDVSGLLMDAEMAEVVRDAKVPVVIMHSIQSPMSRSLHHRVVNSNPYNIIEEVTNDLERMAINALSRGILRQQIILDPGIGFGKTAQESLCLIKHLDRIKALGYPVLLGASRKSFIGNTTQSPVHQRLPGSIAALAVGVLKGADIVRVHDVEESLQAAQIVDAIKMAG